MRKTRPDLKSLVNKEWRYTRKVTLDVGEGLSVACADDDSIGPMYMSPVTVLRTVLPPGAIPVISEGLFSLEQV